MVNYIIRFSNNVYEVVDGNTNRKIAYFVYKIDAIGYHQKLLKRGLALGNPHNPQYQPVSKNNYFKQDINREQPIMHNNESSEIKKERTTVHDIDLASNYDQFLNNKNNTVTHNNKTVEKTKHKTKEMKKNKTGDYATSEYVDSLINGSSYVSPKKRDKNMIDLGPISEEDDIFSTPRKDFEDSKELDDWKITKKDKKNVKKARKRDEKYRKLQDKKIRN